MQKNSLIAIAVVIISLFISMVYFSGCASSNHTGPFGTYTHSEYGIKASVTFNDKDMEMQSPIFGKLEYTYEISNDGTQITLTDKTNHQSNTLSFKYIKDNTVIMNDIIYTR